MGARHDVHAAAVALFGALLVIRVRPGVGPNLVPCHSAGKVLSTDCTHHSRGNIDAAGDYLVEILQRFLGHRKIYGLTLVIEDRIQLGSGGAAVVTSRGLTYLVEVSTVQ